jgi:hypothetical protein
MPCTRETPCGAILYEDSQSRELALAGIPRRVQKCLAGHSFWEGEILPDAIPSISLPAADAAAEGEDDDEIQTGGRELAVRATSATSGAASRPKPRNRDRRIGPPRARRSSASEVTVDGLSLAEIQKLLGDIRAAIGESVETEATETSTV